MFFEMEYDLENYGDRRFLGEARDSRGSEVELWSFMKHESIDVLPPLVFPIAQDGRPVDVSFGSFGEIVVHRRVLEAMGTRLLDGLQIIPARILGSHDDYAAINVLCAYECFDFGRSDYENFYPDGDGRAKLHGNFPVVYRLCIHADRVARAHIFRVKEHSIPVICDCEIRDVFLAIGATGVTFNPLS